MSNQHISQLITLIQTTPANNTVRDLFIRRASEGLLTRDENPSSHFCVYFSGYDPRTKHIFIGHHKKSDLWLFNGGHIDRGETPIEALRREVSEEWGPHIALKDIPSPSLLSITDIDNPTKQPCRRHYEISYFIPLDEDTFEPDAHLLAKEFYQWGWKSLPEAKKIITDPNTITAMSLIVHL